jgi:hypothetical protein
MADWQQDATSDAKAKIRSALAEYLGWSDLRADTHLSEWKFNIWHFHDPTKGHARKAKTRDVRLKIPMPVFRPRGR